MCWRHGPACLPSPAPAPTPTSALDCFAGGADLLVPRRPLPLLLPFPLALDCCVGGADLLVLHRPLPLLLPLPLPLGAQGILPARSSRARPSASVTVSRRAPSRVIVALPARVDCCVGSATRRPASPSSPASSASPTLHPSSPPSRAGAPILPAPPPTTTEAAADVVAVPDSLAMSKAGKADGAATRGSTRAALKISAAETVGNTPCARCVHGTGHRRRDKRTTRWRGRQRQRLCRRGRWVCQPPPNGRSPPLLCGYPVRP